MSATDHYDVIVVGGGPAGLATAVAVAARGMRVVVLERLRPSIDRACGEGVMPDGLESLAALGVVLPGDQTAEFRGIRYLDGPLLAEADFPGRAGRGVRRTVLHDALASRAEEVGVELRWGVRCDGLEDDAVVTDLGRVHGRWIVAADGRASRLRTWAGFAVRSPRRKRYGIRRHFRIEPWTDRVEVHWSDGGEAYVTPVAPDLVGVAILSEGRGRSFDDFLPGFPALCDRLSEAEPASRDLGAGPFGRRCLAVARGRMALVGDAACSLDPISGEGLSVAFHEARAVAEALSNGDLHSYRTAHAAIRRIPSRLTGLLTVMARRPTVRRRAMVALASSDGLFSKMLAVGSRQLPVRLAGPDGVLNMAWELARYAV
jgi:flavin-dependent dehydrogenase